MNFTRSSKHSSPRSKNNDFDPFRSVDSDVFKKSTSSEGSKIDLAKLHELSDEEIDMARDSLPECEMAFTPRQVFFLNKNN